MSTPEKQGSLGEVVEASAASMAAVALRTLSACMLPPCSSGAEAGDGKAASPSVQMVQAPREARGGATTEGATPSRSEAAAALARWLATDGVTKWIGETLILTAATDVRERVAGFLYQVCMHKRGAAPSAPRAVGPPSTGPSQIPSGCHWLALSAS